MICKVHMLDFHDEILILEWDSKFRYVVKETHRGRFFSEWVVIPSIPEEYQ